MLMKSAATSGRSIALAAPHPQACRATAFRRFAPSGHSARLQIASQRPQKMKAAAERPVSGDESMSRREPGLRSEEHTTELPSLTRNSYAVFRLEKKKTQD